MKNSKWWLLAVMMLSTFMAGLDSTIVNVGLPTIMRYFSSPIESVQWVVTSYLVAMCVMLPTAGWMAEKWGYRRMFLVGMVVFTLGSLFSSLSESLDMLIASRIFEGLGSGIIQPIAMAVVIGEFDSKTRGFALGMWAVAAAASVSMGPYLGGILVSDYSWNSLFMVNVPIGIVVSVAALFIMSGSGERRVGRFDFLGFLLVSIGLPLMVVALSMGGDNGWGSFEVISLFILSLLMLWGFVRRSLRIDYPIINLNIFRSSTFSISMIALAFFSIGLYSGTYLLPLYLEHALGYTAIAAGAAFLPVGVIQGVLAPITGVLSRYTGNKILIIAGLIVFISYFMVSAFFDTHTSNSLIMLSLYLRGLGIGLAFTPLNTLSVEPIDGKDMASASGVSNTVKQIFGSIAIAVFTALLSSRVAHHGASMSVDSAYVSAISESFWVSAIFATAGFVFVLFLKEKPAKK